MNDIWPMTSIFHLNGPIRLCRIFFLRLLWNLVPAKYISIENVTNIFDSTAVLTYSAAIIDNGSMLSCFIKWDNGSKPSRFELSGSHDTAVKLLLDVRRLMFFNAFVSVTWWKNEQNGNYGRSLHSLRHTNSIRVSPLSMLSMDGLPPHCAANIS